MRKLIALLTIFSIQNAYCVAPSGVGGEQGTLNYTNNIKAPNYQVTSLGGVNSRMETGNTNLLMNPSFEHPTVGTGWTVTNATSSADITNMVEGKKALSLAVTGAMLVTQDSTINAANISGLQGVASIKIKATGTTGLKVCPRTAGAAVTNLCVNVTADNTWKHVLIPFILGITSNGIGIATTATGGTVIVDDAFVGTSDPFQNVNSESVFSAKVSSTGVISDISKSGWVTCSSAAPYTCTFATGLFTVAPNCWAQTTATATNSIAYAVYAATASSVSIDLTTTNGLNTRISQSFNLFCQKQGVDVPLASRIYSQSSQDYDWTAYTPTSPNSSLTLSATSCYHKRKGSDLYVRCNLTHSAVAASEAQISLPNSLVISSNIPSITNAACGRVSRSGFDSSTYHSSLLCTGGQSYFRFGTRNNTATDLTAKLANAVFVAGESMYFESGPIPISGWSDYGVIVGSFAGIEKCANDYECTDTFSAVVGDTGIVSNENIDWINGNCATPSTGVKDCTLVSTLKDGVSGLGSKLNCVVTQIEGVGGTGLNASYSIDTSTTSLIRLSTANAGTPANYRMIVKCQKGSQDYKPKTAKVASSIGVPTVPGITTQAVDTFSVSYAGSNAGNPASWTNCTTGTCNIDQIGTGVSTIVWGSAGSYTLNLSKTYSKLKCAANATTVGTGYQVVSQIACLSCSSLTFATGSAANTAGTLICQGTY